MPVRQIHGLLGLQWQLGELEVNATTIGVDDKRHPGWRPPSAHRRL